MTRFKLGLAIGAAMVMTSCGKSGADCFSAAQCESGQACEGGVCVEATIDSYHRDARESALEIVEAEIFGEFNDHVVQSGAMEGRIMETPFGVELETWRYLEDDTWGMTIVYFPHLNRAHHIADADDPLVGIVGCTGLGPDMLWDEEPVDGTINVGTDANDQVEIDYDVTFDDGGFVRGRLVMAPK